jgi:hypothetical protein
MKFISQNNTYEFDSIDWKNDLIALYIDNQYCVLRFDGDVEFFRDGDGVGLIWDDFSHDITVQVVHELSDENLVLLNFHEEYVVEWIAEQIYLDKEKDCE